MSQLAPRWCFINSCEGIVEVVRVSRAVIINFVLSVFLHLPMSLQQNPSYSPGIQPASCYQNSPATPGYHCQQAGKNCAGEMPALLNQATSSTRSWLVIIVVAFMGLQEVPWAQTRLHHICSVQGIEMFQLQAEKSWQRQAMQAAGVVLALWILGFFWCDWIVDKRIRADGW